MANKHDVQLRTQLLEKLFPTVETVDNLDSDNPNRPLSARQGKVLKELIKSGGGGPGLSIEVVETLPNTGSAGILYLVPKSSSYLKEKNNYDEYVWIESTSKYELVGSFSTDLDINEIKSILGEISEINVATLINNGINNYTTTGTYRIYGERINDKDGLPILNSGNGHTVEGTLRVYDSSIAGTGKDTDKVVTQILSMSNRTGGDGHIWIRTGQGSNKDNLTWSTWEKLQGIFEKNTITDISELNTFTTNGIYSCMYVGNDDVVLDSTINIKRGSTLLIIVINGYMASGIGLNPQLTQSIILTPPNPYNSYIFTRHATYTNNSWEFINTSNIVLGSVYAVDVNIGTAGNPNGRINIGTYAHSKVSINNAFIGDVNSRGLTNSNSVVIDTGIIIERNANIGNNTYIAQKTIIGTDTIDNATCHIGMKVDIEDNMKLLDQDNKFHIKSDNNNAYLTLTNNTKVNIDADNISNNGGDKNIKLECNNIRIGSSNVGEIYIGANAIILDNVKIGNSANIGDNVNIGRNVTIPDNFNIANSVNIGDNVILGDDVKIVTISSNTIINDDTFIGYGANIKEGVTIANGVNLANNVIIGSDVHIEPSAYIGGSASIGQSTIIGASVDISNNVNINSNVSIGSAVIIGDNVNIGNNLNLKNDVTIGNNVTIGNGLSLSNASNIITIASEGSNQVDIAFNTVNIGSIVFEENSIRFSVGNKSATIQLT